MISVVYLITSNKISDITEIRLVITLHRNALIYVEVDIIIDELLNYR